MLDHFGRVIVTVVDEDDLTGDVYKGLRKA
jgi:hypothetical protein